MDYYSYIICLLVFGNSLFTVVQGGGNGNDEEAFKFEVELIRTMRTATATTRIHPTGWELTNDPKTLKKMCVAAATFISFELKGPNINFFVKDWGTLSYPRKENDKYTNYVYCGATPRDFYIRAAGPPSERSYIIMVEDFEPSPDDFYEMSPREYIFDVKIMETNPIQSANDNLEKDLLSAIENFDLRNAYVPGDEVFGYDAGLFVGERLCFKPLFYFEA